MEAWLVSSPYNQVAGTSLERIAALSDGLFAIAMTLIVLEIRLPSPVTIHTDHALWRALRELTPRLVTYLMSFLTLGIFWVGQQTQLNLCTRADRNLSWLHLSFLTGVSTMPFSTKLLAEFIAFRPALIVYWLNLLILGAALYATWYYAGRAGLVKEGVPPEIFKAVERRIAVAQGLYASGAALCFINTAWSIGFIVLVQLNYAIAPRIRFLARLTS